MSKSSEDFAVNEFRALAGKLVSLDDRFYGSFTTNRDALAAYLDTSPDSPLSLFVRTVEDVRKNFTENTAEWQDAVLSVGGELAQLTLSAMTGGSSWVAALLDMIDPEAFHHHCENCPK